ncbi:MAG: cation diffusion facilitator family transporter [Roseburia sp.]
MVGVLAKIFIRGEKEESKVRQAYGMLCGIVGILLNILLFAGKFLAGTISNSIAITADAFNNLSDAASSVVTLLGFHFAGAKPDPDHPFGHGRIEYISGLGVAGLILIMAYELIRDSIKKILHPEQTEFSALIVAILLAAILVKLYMFFYNHSIGKKINSAAMKATAIDSLSDTAATTVVLVATLVAHFTGLQIDGYCGVAVGLFILYAGVNAAKDTLNPLLGQAPDPEEVEQIKEIVMAHEKICGIHDLIVHDYGPGRQMISLHAEVSAEDNILEIHDEIDLIEMELKEKLHCDATIHMDPVVTTDEHLKEMKARTVEIVTQIDERISLHDFRMVAGPSHTNLIFDIVVPFKCKMEDNELVEEIQRRIQKEIGENYFTVIQIDRYYV